MVHACDPSAGQTGRSSGLPGQPAQLNQSALDSMGDSFSKSTVESNRRN